MSVFVILGGKCRPLVNHVEYAPRGLLRLEKETGHRDGRTHGRQTLTLSFPLDAASVKIGNEEKRRLTECVDTGRVTPLRSCRRRGASMSPENVPCCGTAVN